MFDIDEVTKTAVELGITLTEAEDGTEIYDCWAARVMQAKMHHERGQTKGVAEMIESANAYAIPSTRTFRF